MKCIGLIGGMSWESTALYYRSINEDVRKRRGAPRSAHILLHSLDFGEIFTLQERGEWKRLEAIVTASAVTLERAGADLLLICSNTMHAVAKAVSTAVSIPLLHIADAAGKAARERGLERVGVLGTKLTMEGSLYRKQFCDNWGLDVLLPEEDEQQCIDAIIFRELCRGIVSETGREQCLAVIDRLASRGAEGIILGCTELPLLLSGMKTAVPLLDTTALHAAAAVEMALS